MKNIVNPNALRVVISTGNLSFANLTPAMTPQLYTDTTSEAGKADQAWFKENPDRKHHFREFMDGDELDFVDYLFVLRKDPKGLRRVPVPAEFIPPDEEDFAEVLYLMSLEVIEANARAELAGKNEDSKYIDRAQYVERVYHLKVLRRLLA